MQVRMINSVVHEWTTRQWFSYNFIITTIDGLMLRTAIVVITRQAVRLAAIVVVVVDAVRVRRQVIWVGMQVMRVMMVVGDESGICQMILLY